MTREMQGRSLERLERMTRMMDARFRLPGTSVRFGWDVLLGLVPGIGDLVSGAVSLMLLREARRAGVGWSGQARMVGNILIDGLVGTVPVLGDVFDLAFKANERNLAILRKHLPADPDVDVTPVTDDPDASMNRVLAATILAVVSGTIILLMILLSSWNGS